MSRDVIGQVTIRSPHGPFPIVVKRSLYLQPFSRYWALSMILGSRVTRRHRFHDHLIPHNAISYLWSFVTNGFGDIYDTMVHVTLNDL